MTVYLLSVSCTRLTSIDDSEKMLYICHKYKFHMKNNAWNFYSGGKYIMTIIASVIKLMYLYTYECTYV
jgi:hypothetical protein